MQDVVLGTGTALGTASPPDAPLGPALTDRRCSRDQHRERRFEPRAGGPQLSPWGGSRVWGVPHAERGACQEEPHPG